MSAFDKTSLAALKQFVQLIAANPAVLHTPELSFFKSYLESLGAKIPKAPAAAPGAADEGHGHAHAHGGHGHAHGGHDGEGGGHGHSHGGKACHGHGGDTESESKAEGQPMDDDEDDDEPLEFKFDEPEPIMEAAEDKFDDGLETVTPDVVDDTVSTVPDMSIEPSDEAIEKASAEKQAALAALESGDHASAIAHYTTAISLNPASSLLVAGRAAIFLAQKKPNAAIKDANIALQANPDSAKALKIRGKAYTLLGDYENAHKDLSRGLQVDYDDDTQQLAKKVQARVDTVHRRVRKHELAKEEWMKRKVMAQRAWIKKKQEWEERRRQREEAEAMNDDNPYAGAGGQPNMADFAKMFGGAGGAGGGQPNMADFAKMFGGGGAGGAGGQPNMADFAKMFGGAGGAGGPDLSSMFGGAGRGVGGAGAGAGAGAGPKPTQAAEEVD